MLTAIIFLPVFGILALVFLPRGNAELIKKTAFGSSLLTFLMSVPLYFNFNSSTADMQFVQKIPWIEGFGVSYHVGIDGISLFLVLLTTFLTAICILASWNVTKRIKEYMVAMLILETGMIGVFVSLDLLLFYVFWEIMLIPMYLIIGIWGGPRRIYAAVKFFLYTMAGSVLMLVGILTLVFTQYKTTGNITFDLLEHFKGDIPENIQWFLFVSFGLAFAVKVPMFPFHTWLPDAHVEAPTAGSVLLAGVLLKMGTYGFVRFCLPLCPYAAREAVSVICFLAVVGIIYGALMALVQSDIKKLVAYSSVSHLGFVVLGIFALNMEGIKGGIIQMVNHGLSTGCLFLLVGMIYERRHTREISEYGGLIHQIPVYSGFFLIAVFSSMALPGLNGFVGEFLILAGAFRANVVYGAVAIIGVMLGASYLLWTYQRMMLNQIDNPKNRKLKDLNTRELAVLLPMVFFIVWIGVYSKPFLSKMDASVENLVKITEQGLQRTRPESEENQSSVYELLTGEQKTQR